MYKHISAKKSNFFYDNKASFFTILTQKLNHLRSLIFFTQLFSNTLQIFIHKF